MTTQLLICAAVVLAVERVAYVLISRYSGAFQAWVAGRQRDQVACPVDAVRILFVFFKVLQAIVFGGWIVLHSQQGWAPPAAKVLVPAIACVGLGQALNVAVFWRLGRTRVFFGDKFGYEGPRVRGFPFSLLDHPQYVGTVLSIWGLFLMARFPYPDWYLLPALETAYYAAGSWLER